MPTLPTIPLPKKSKDRLTGIPDEHTLPDLVLEQGESTHPVTTQGADTTGTEEELDAAR